MNTKKIIIIALILIAVVSVGYYFGSYLMKKETISVMQESEETDLKFSFDDNIAKNYKAVGYHESSYNYKLSDNEIIPTDKYRLKIKSTGDLFEGDISTTFSIFKDGKLVSTNNNDLWGRIDEIGSLKLNNVDYYLLKSYSGGAHCCYALQAITFENDDFHLGKTIDLLESGEQMGKNYFEKDNQLYFMVYSSDLVEFHTSYAGSMYFPVFYRVDSNSADFVSVNNEFVEYYQQLVADINNDIEVIKTNLVDKIDFSSANVNDSAEEIFSLLARRLVVGILANTNIEIAKKQFVDDCNLFFKDGMIEGQKAEDVANEAINKVAE